MTVAFIFIVGVVLLAYQACRAAVIVREWPNLKLGLLVAILWVFVGLALIFVALSQWGATRG